MIISFSTVPQAKDFTKRICPEGHSLSKFRESFAHLNGFRNCQDFAKNFQPKPSFLISPDDLIKLSLFARRNRINSGILTHALITTGLSRVSNLIEAEELLGKIIRHNEMPLSPDSRVFGQYLDSSSGGPFTILEESRRKAAKGWTRTSENALRASWEVKNPLSSNRARIIVPDRIFLLYFSQESSEGTILFDRNYRPIWKCRKGLHASRLKGDEQLELLNDRKYLWDGYPATKAMPSLAEISDMYGLYNIQGIPASVDRLLSSIA